jgi:hypothetical protein
MAPAHVRHLRPVTLGDLLVLFAATACLLDAFSTWAALTSSGSFYEHTPATASFIAWWGLAGGLSISVLLRVAVFASLAVAMQRLPKFSLPLFAIGFVAAMLTWLIVLANAAALAAN